MILRLLSGNVYEIIKGESKLVKGELKTLLLNESISTLLICCCQDRIVLKFMPMFLNETKKTNLLSSFYTCSLLND